MNRTKEFLASQGTSIPNDILAGEVYLMGCAYERAEAAIEYAEHVLSEIDGAVALQEQIDDDYIVETFGFDPEVVTLVEYQNIAVRIVQGG